MWDHANCLITLNRLRFCYFSLYLLMIIYKYYIMNARNLLNLLILTLFLGCSKSEPKSYEYWNDLTNKKYAEINVLIHSVSCSNIEDFEIVATGRNFYAVHPSIRESFDRLKAELEGLEREREIAGSRESFAGATEQSLFPNPPVKMMCENGKPLLIYANNLTLDEVNLELPIRYDEIRTFYENVPCTDANQWNGRYILSQNCSVESFSVHKTIRKDEMNTKLDVYNMLMIRKMALERTKCETAFLTKKLLSNEPVKCEAGKPVVIEN